MKRPGLVVGADAAALRRRVGPLAWCALEVLMARSRSAGDGSVTAAASVCAVADDLGVATNTAHRALKTLRTAGLLEHHQSRDGAGFFSVTIYRLVVPIDALCPSSNFPELLQQNVSRRSRTDQPSAAPVTATEQLVLLLSD